MSETTRYPLCWPAGWPRTANPKRSHFGTGNTYQGRKRPSIAEACDFLMGEIKRLTGTNRDVIISTNLKYKIDGQPYSQQRQPDDQGAAVYFDMPDENGRPQNIVIACDNYDLIGCNLYAIAKTVEALRGIERWGASELLKRAFTGFKALPETASPSSWYQVLELPVNASADQIKDKYRELVKKYHPDNQLTGDAEKFIQVQKAYEDAVKQF